MELSEWQAFGFSESPVAAVADTPISGSSDDGLSTEALNRPGATTPSSVARMAASKKKRAPRVATRSVNISRERRKQELEYLRTLVGDLQGELTTLQDRRDEMLRPHLAGDTGALVTIAPVWEGLAKRQFQARKKAGMENARLKTLITAQAQVVEDLIDVIQRARQIEQDVFGLQQIQPLATQDDTIQDQLTRIRILCGQWFVAFSWYSQLQSGPMRSFESRVVSDDGTETVLDIFSNQSFPFSVAEVEHALWTIFQAECAEDQYAYSQNCEASDNTLIGKFTASSYRDGVRAALKGTYVTRRFRNDQGHFLTASNVYAAPDTASGVNPEKDFILTEDTWVRILDARELSGVVAITESTSTLTVLQHVRRSRIRFMNPDQAGDARLQTFMQLHLLLVEEELRWGQQSIESMLMRGLTDEPMSL